MINKPFNVELLSLYLQPLNYIVPIIILASLHILLFLPRKTRRIFALNKSSAGHIAIPDARIMLAVMLRMSDGMRDAVWGQMLGLRESPKI